MVKTKELIQIELASNSIEKGNLACPGCSLNANFKHTLSALKGDAIVVVPACCTSVIQGAGEGYGMQVPIFNTAFAAAPAVASGIKRKLIRDGNDHTQVIVWAGDGGTSDIGLAALSGAAERDEDIIYIMYNNEAYQNTGAQKSGSTPRASKTTTTATGKTNRSKSVAQMMVAQGVSYVATANVAHPTDLYDKVVRAATEFKGTFRYLEYYSPCPPGWDIETKDTITVARLANDTGYWPLWEAVDGVLKLSRPSKRFLDPAKRKPFAEYMKYQGRYKNVDPELVEEAVADINYKWSWVKRFMTEL